MSLARPFVAHVKVLVTLIPLTGCFVLVDTFEVRDQCGIQGSGACAACIRSSCQGTVDACCRSATCGAGSILDDADACGSGETSRCAIALATERSGGDDEALRQCMLTSCQSACTVPSSADDPARFTCDAPRAGTSRCEQCVREACATKLDQCCADNTCADERDIQLDLGTCFAGDSRACVWRFRSASADGTSGIVRQCVVDHCYDACLGDGLPHTSCTPRASGTYCTCENAEDSSGPECSAKEVGVDYCVIGRRGCTCGAFRIASSARSGCTMDYRGGAQSHSDVPCVAHSEGRCCLSLEDDGISCECDTSEYATPCTESEYSISECSESAIKEKIGERVVPSCSR